MALQWQPGNAVWLNHTLNTRQALRQALRQGARLALLARHLLLRVGLAGCDLFRDGGNLRLGLGDGRLKILQRQLQLRRIQFFRFRPEPGAAAILNLAFQLLDQRL